MSMAHMMSERGGQAHISGHQSLSLSSRGSYIVVWRWSGDAVSRSDSLEGLLCPPLPGQVPVEPTETSNGLTAQGAMEASPVNKCSTEKPTERRKRKRIRSFLNRLWKAMKSPFRCCCPCSDVDVVEPFVPPPDLEPEPDPEPPSPAPDHSGVKPVNESFESLYNVGEMIGSGGFGRVYEGTRKFDGKKVAIKRMLKIDNDRYLDIPGHPKPLVTEVALLLMMRREPISPFVIQLYEWFEHPQKFTLVMEYPEPCESLRDFITRNPQLYEPTARVIMQQALLAVQHCIEHGVFHNDIHAQNFLLNKNTFQLKLIDFGCGQLFSSDGYESDIYIGAPDYCPPEVLTEPLFHAVPTNVWALGVLLYKMVNACRPFRNRREITQAKVTFQNSKLSKGNNILAVLGGGLELET
ncbi:serine/threonine-protein kinase pim-2-like isoform X2 [Ctenopharyngodon idella]|uniref:serine/threonine-protein kinase pim-2-like isoform X2 n=1 Tax=Ctenopharyngodon idella TaxID=7959 RepID=UPI00223082A9|nr:serine/threonine-protein kinase pim-2-like isoform X2 [Ctenopharyngodon idella]